MQKTMSRFLSSIIHNSSLSKTLLTRPALLPLSSIRGTRNCSTTLPRMSEDNPKTVRPPHKRVKESDEHIDPSNTNQKLSDAKGVSMKEGEMPEWLTKPPFSYGQSWEGWERKWRCSCWCGQSRSEAMQRGMRLITSCILVLWRPARCQGMSL